MTSRSMFAWQKDRRFTVQTAVCCEMAAKNARTTSKPSMCNLMLPVAAMTGNRFIVVRPQGV
jgi:hypothetical protein